MPRDKENPRHISRRETWQLVGAAYRDSLPWLLLLIGVLFIVLWFLTEVFFV